MNKERGNIDVNKDDDICWKELEPATKQLEIFKLKVVK